MKFIEKEKIEYKVICSNCGGLVVYKESDVDHNKTHYSERDIDYISDYVRCPNCNCENYLYGNRNF